MEPVSGVRVALDRPDGTRLGEANSNAEGLVVFEVGEDMWPVDVAVSATAYKSGFPMHTLTGISRPSTAEPLAVTLNAPWQDPPEMVRVSGTVLNRRQQDLVYVTSTAPFSEVFAADSDAWSLETPAGVPFDLVAWQRIYSQQSNWDYDQPFFHWALVSSEALEDDAVVDIDFTAHAVQPTEFAGSFLLPERPESPLRRSSTWPYVVIFAGGS
jgi:hypothetical protein